MGLDRLRRGFSLEVIFEEDSDFCSHFDSLDAVPLPTSTDRNNNQKFSVIELFGVSTSGTEDDSWESEEDRSNYNSSGHSSTLNSTTITNTNTTHHTQIQQLRHNKILDRILDHKKDMDTCCIEWDGFSPDSLNRENFDDCHSRGETSREHSPSSESHGRRSRVSRRQIVEANWIMDDNDFDLLTQNEQNYNSTLSKSKEVLDTSSLTCKSTRICPRRYYYSMDSPIVIIDPTTVQLVNNTYSTTLNQEESGRFSELNSKDEDSPSHLAGSDYSSLVSKPEIYSATESRSTSTSSSSTDVKKVCAVFESGHRVSSFDDDTISSSGNQIYQQKFSKRNTSTTNLIRKSKLEKKISSGSSSNSLSSPSLRSAYSHMTLNQMERYDFVDLLVNDNVIIEDSPDLYQTLRHTRNRSESTEFGDTSISSKSNLRRSKSMGTGIQNIEPEINHTVDLSTKERPCIIAEELPARNTVRNVRSVFEQILQKNVPSGMDKDSSNNLKGLPFDNNGFLNNGIKKTLSSVKSNPTSKIFRSESTDGSIGRDRVGIPILLKCNSVNGDSVHGPKTTNPRPSPENTVNTKEKSNFTFEGIQKISIDEDTVSLTSSGTLEEVDEPKRISVDVLNRIRSLGTTTTYYGGEILSKTIRNQKCAVGIPRNRLMEDEIDEVDNIFSPLTPTQDQINNTKDLYFLSKPMKNQSPLDSQRPFHLPLENFYRSNNGDTTPRIISVLPKSSSNSPTKSNSPIGSFLEERNSPEGCESNPDDEYGLEQGWINTTDEWEKRIPINIRKNGDRNNNSKGKHQEVKNSYNSKKFSEAAEGVWF